MTTLLAFAVTIGILVVIHEFGHYALARLCGVKVLRFSVGFGPVIAKRKSRNGTEWALSAVPLGGYVKMVDEREGEVDAADLPYAFNRKSVGQRMAIVVAGPAANLILAVLLYWALFISGVTVLKPIVAEPAAGTPAAQAGFRSGETITAVDGEPVDDWQGLYWVMVKRGMQHPDVTIETVDAGGHIAYRRLDISGTDLAEVDSDPLAHIGLARYLPPIPPVIGQVVAGSPAEQAGMRVNDRILSIDGQPVTEWKDVVEQVRKAPEQRLAVRVERNGRTVPLSITPAVTQTAGKAVGRIGAAAKVDESLFTPLEKEIRFGPVEAMKRAVYKTWDLSAFSLEMMGKLVIGQASLKNISGPVTIADYAGRSAEAGLSTFIAFLALISVSLGVLNLLPIPLLDGGHLLYYSAEFLTGRPVPDSVQEVGQKIGAALLAALMLFALYNDFHRLLAG